MHDILVVHNTRHMKTQGIRRVGYVKTSRRVLIERFGEPTNNTDEGFEWCLEFEVEVADTHDDFDTHHVTIYDDMANLDQDQEISWRIGGLNRLAVDLVDQVVQGYTDFRLVED